MTPQDQNALVKKAPAKRELKEWLQGETFKRELAALLPRTMSPERFVRIAFQATHRNPELLSCSQESFFNCLLSLGAMGLEPDGRNAHLIPFRDTQRGTLECTLIVDYKGIAQLLRRNKDVATLHCDVVYTRDEYEAEQGTNQHLRHVKAKGERGEPLLAYSFVRLTDGSQEFEEMAIVEIEAIRRRSKSPNKGPWVTDWDAMARKTVFRRHAKMLPLSPETRDALERDSDGDSLAQVPMAQANVISPKPASSAPAAAAQSARKRSIRPGKLAQDLEQSQEADTLAETPEPVSEELFEADKANTAASQPKAPSKAKGAPALSEVLAQKLEADGFRADELLSVLKSVRLIEAHHQDLDSLPERIVAMALQDWDNALGRMAEARQAAAGGTRS